MLNKWWWVMGPPSIWNMKYEIYMDLMSSFKSWIAWKCTRFSSKYIKVLQLQKPCWTMSKYEYGLFSINVDLELFNIIAWFKHDDNWLLIEKSDIRSKWMCLCVAGLRNSWWLVPIPTFINIIFIHFDQILFIEPSVSIYYFILVASTLDIFD